MTNQDSVLTLKTGDFKREDHSLLFHLLAHNLFVKLPQRKFTTRRDGR